MQSCHPPKPKLPCHYQTNELKSAMNNNHPKTHRRCKPINPYPLFLSLRFVFSLSLSDLCVLSLSDPLSNAQIHAAATSSTMLLSACPCQNHSPTTPTHHDIIVTQATTLYFMSLHLHEPVNQPPISSLFTFIDPVNQPPSLASLSPPHNPIIANQNITCVDLCALLANTQVWIYSNLHLNQKVGYFNLVRTENRPKILQGLNFYILIFIGTKNIFQQKNITIFNIYSPI